VPDLAPGLGAPGWQAGLSRRPALRYPARVLALLPPGTIPVGAGLAILGGGSFAHLAVAGHTLPTAGMAQMSVLWSLVFLLGLGVFFPVEQELIRLVSARTAAGQGIGPVVRRGATLALGIAMVLLAAFTLAAGPLASRLFGGDTTMVAVLGGATVALAVTAVSRGTLAGLGRFGSYGRQLAVDGGLRVLLACALGAAGARTPVPYGLILIAAPLLAVAVTLRPLLAQLHPGPPADWRAMGGRLGLLIATMLLAQVVINVAVINVRLLSPGDPALTGALLAAVVLARVPLFVFTAVQTSLLPGLCGALAAGERARYRLLLGRTCAAVTVLGLVGGVPAIILGPWLTRVLFAARPVLGSAAFAWLAAGTLCYMLALVLGQGVLALGRHRDQMLAWLAGVAVLTAITLASGPVTLRVVIAYTAGSATVALVMGGVLIARGVLSRA
jgi:O-antigen/teichoic acid export membrane protein